MAVTLPKDFLFVLNKGVYSTLEDKHFVNEYPIIQKNHDDTEKCPHVVHLNVPRDWFEINSQHQKCYSKGTNKIVDVAVYWEV